MVFRQSVTALGAKQHREVNDDGPALLHPSMYICSCGNGAVAAMKAYRSQRNVKCVIETVYELSNLLCLFIYLKILMAACSPSWRRLCGGGCKSKCTKSADY